MRSTQFHRRLLPLLCLPLLSTGCATTSTLTSLARTEQRKPAKAYGCTRTEFESGKSGTSC